MIEPLLQGIYSLIQEESNPAGGRNCPPSEASPSTNDEETTQLDKRCKTDNSEVYIFNIAASFNLI